MSDSGNYRPSHQQRDSFRHSGLRGGRMPPQDQSSAPATSSSSSVMFQFAPTVTPHTYKALGSNTLPNVDPSVLESMGPDVTFTRAAHTQKRRERKQNKDPDHVPRPPNAFIMWRTHFVQHEYNASDHPSGRDLSKVTGETWNALDESQKDIWRQKAAKVKFDFDMKNPNYKYKPNHREKKEKGKRDSASDDGPMQESDDGEMDTGVAAEVSSSPQVPKKRRKATGKRATKKQKFGQTIDFHGEDSYSSSQPGSPPALSPTFYKDSRPRSSSIPHVSGLRHIRPAPAPAPVSIPKEPYRQIAASRRSMPNTSIHSSSVDHSRSAGDGRDWDAPRLRQSHWEAGSSTRATSSSTSRKAPVFRDPFMPSRPLLSPPESDSSSEGEDDSVPMMKGPIAGQSQSKYVSSRQPPIYSAQRTRQHSYVNGGVSPEWERDRDRESGMRRQSVPTYTNPIASGQHSQARIQSSRSPQHRHGRMRWSASAATGSAPGGSGKSAPKSIEELHSEAKELRSEYPATSDEESSEDEYERGYYSSQLPPLSAPPVSRTFVGKDSRAFMGKESRPIYAPSSHRRSSSTSPSTQRVQMTRQQWSPPPPRRIMASDVDMGDGEQESSDDNGDDGVSIHSRVGAMRTSGVRNLPM